MSDLRTAAQQALEALEYRDGDGADQWKADVITALRAALRSALAQEQAEPVQEPVAVVRWDDIGHISWRALVMLPDGTPLYTTLPKAGPVQEPVAWLQPKTVSGHLRPDLGHETCSKDDYGAFPVYRVPPKAEPAQEPVAQAVAEKPRG